MKDDQLKHGAFSWIELMTTDTATVKDFYTRLFGWATEDMEMEGMTYTVVRAGGKEVGGIMAVPPEAQGTPPHWGTYVTVDDVDVVAAKVPELGGTLIVPPRDIPDVGRFCVIQDPQGAMIAAITYVECAGT